MKQLWHLGANFASSPARILIDLTDPLVVAEKIATTDRNSLVTIGDITKELGDGGRRIGRQICHRKTNLKYITICNIFVIQM